MLSGRNGTGLIDEVHKLLVGCRNIQGRTLII